MNTAREITATITCAAAGDYGAGDVLSASATNDAGLATELDGIVQANGQGVTFLGGSAVCSEDSVLFRLRLHVFRLAPVAAEVEMDDNAAYSIVTAAGAAKWLCDLDFSAFVDKGAVALAEMTTVPKTVKTPGSSTSLYVVAETLDAEANETASMTIDLRLWVI